MTEAIQGVAGEPPVEIARIKPEDVVAAYRVTGLKPGTATLWPEQDPLHVCGLGALRARDFPAGDRIDDYFGGLDTKFDRNYLWGFAGGFDTPPARFAAEGRDRDTPTGPTEPVGMGHRDGQAARVAVEREFGPIA